MAKLSGSERGLGPTKLQGAGPSVPLLIFYFFSVFPTGRKL